MDYNIPEKANRVLNIIILGLLLILVRTWYLAVVQHDEHVEKARRPRRRTVIEKVERATIRDRFNIPLALNKIQLNAAVCYADIRQIPTAKWEKKPDGKRVRVPVRTTYIQQLSELLAEELKMDPQVIEDTIHGKASLFPHTPFVIKEDLTEEEYFRLKMLEKDWVGIRTERGSMRTYPFGKIGSDVLGYMGAISSNEYYAIAGELKLLQTYLSEREAGEMAVLPKGFNNPLEVRERVKALQERAYTINDLVGKAGVEASFEADLRGFAGKKTFEVDTRGNVLRELPGGRDAVSGKRLLLSISLELQKFAEQLLTQNEHVREKRNADGSADLSTPWIKGGAIVAMDPNTGEVLALASYPRVDPNDFIASRIPEVRAVKQANIIKWLENEAYIGEIWDGKRPLERERFNASTQAFYEEKIDLSLDRYLEMILPKDSPIRAAVHQIGTVQAAIAFESAMEKLLLLSGQEKWPVLLGALYADKAHHLSRQKVSAEQKKNAQRSLVQNAGEVQELRNQIDPILAQVPHNDDQLLVLDLCRMLVDKERFSKDLLECTSGLSLRGYRLLNQSVSIVEKHLKLEAKEWFHRADFQSWRKEHFKDYLRQKRREEKEMKKYARPYTEYLEQIERQMFNAFWEEHKVDLLHACMSEVDDGATTAPFLAEVRLLKQSHAEVKEQAEKVYRSFSELPMHLQRELIQTFRSFDELNRPLYGRYRSLRHVKGQFLEKHLAAGFYPLAGYGYGRSQAFRQSTPQGSVFKLVPAYQALRERYEQLQQWQRHVDDLNPLTLTDNLQWHKNPGCNDQILGYFTDGQPIRRLYKEGRLPRTKRDLGKINLVSAIEQSSNLYFAILSIDHLQDPLHLIYAAMHFGFGQKTGIELPGEISGTLPNDVTHNRTGLYALSIGQHSLVVTPLQTAILIGAIANKGKVLKPKIIQVIAGQEPLREYRDPFAQTQFAFQDHLSSVGIHFPLFSVTQSDASSPFVWTNTPEIKWQLPMPDIIRNPIIEGMNRTIVGSKGTARPNIIRALARNPQWYRDYMEMKDRIIGKTGTAEILYKPTIDAESKAYIQNHIWFAGAVFAKESPQTWENPELVITVYLRYSEAGGKEAAPLAVEIAKKWQEICSRHGKTAFVETQELIE